MQIEYALAAVASGAPSVGIKGLSFVFYYCVLRFKRLPFWQVQCQIRVTWGKRQGNK